ncbi:nitroreductase family protein [Companilactobacillus farciminis]
MIKKIIKQFVPKSWIIRYKMAKEHQRLKRDFRIDAKQYDSSFNYSPVGTSDEGVKELLIFHSHSIEKGLSHPNFRGNFGKNALLGIKANLSEFKKRNLDKNLFEYQNTISVLKFYKEKHNSKNIETPFFDSLFDLNEIDVAPSIAGAKVHTNKFSKNMNFVDLEYFRSTQREFSNDAVDMDVFKKVTELAVKTPSVCNRQPWKTYVTNDSSKISKLLDLQGGYKGYGVPPTLSLVTVDRRAFIGSHERNEPYVDGGLFLMNYDFALTYYGLSSCILNTMMEEPMKEEVRTILGVPASEVLIAFVGAGYSKDKVEIAASARKPIEDILKMV